ncbi:hypothetical protein GYB59_02195 [bacterium]|nr:hypothetical protein [bacterium]
MNDLKAAAKANGLKWKDVKAVAQDLKAAARLDREWEWSIRYRVWELYAYSKGSQPFWRHGMQTRYNKAFEDGDMTMIPGFDVTADLIAMEFLGCHGDNDPSQWLFEFLREPHNAMPPAREFYSQAIDYLLSGGEVAVAICECEADF